MPLKSRDEHTDRQTDNSKTCTSNKLLRKKTCLDFKISGTEEVLNSSSWHWGSVQTM